MERIKVLHLITHLGVGGALDNTLVTVKDLPRDRYQVDLAAGVLTGEHHKLWQARAEESADRLVIFPDMRRTPHLIRDKHSLQQITDLIREGGYDIVHTHCSKAGALGRIACLL